MGQRAFEHVADDFHVAMAVGAETGARRDAVFVDDAQVPEPHVVAVQVVREREAVVALEPAVIGVAALFGFAKRQHDGCTVGSAVAAVTQPALKAPFK